MRDQRKLKKTWVQKMIALIQNMRKLAQNAHQKTALALLKVENDGRWMRKHVCLLSMMGNCGHLRGISWTDAEYHFTGSLIALCLCSPVVPSASLSASTIAPLYLVFDL